MESPEHELHSANASPSARAEVPADQAPTVRCILTLARSGRVPPVDLLEALAARRIEVRECVGVFSTMATLLEYQHQNDSRATAVILVEPGLHRAGRAEELLAAIDRFAPGVACWKYDVSATPKLDRWRRESPSPVAKPVVEDHPHLPASKVNGIKEAIRKAEGSPSLRLTSHDAALPIHPHSQESPDSESSHILGAGEEHPASSPETLLTEAELAMLLDLGDPLDPPARTNGANVKKPIEHHPFDASYEQQDE